MIRNIFIFLMIFVSPSVFALNMCSPTNQTSTNTSDTFFDSGGAGGKYGNSENCSLLIQPAGGGNITLTFTVFETRNNQDVLTVYDGSDNTGTLLGTFFGNPALPFDVVATSGSMFIEWVTNPGGNDPGWEASWNTVISPPVALDHFDIDTNGVVGSVCSPQQITIRACADASCTTLVTDYTGTVGISTASGVGNWATSGNGTLTPDPDNDDNGSVDYTFDVADSGSVIFNLTHLLAASTTITVDDGAGVTDTSTAIQFNENAFLIEDIDSLPGDDVLVAGRDHAYRATMIARADSLSLQCSAVTSYTGSQALEGWVTRTFDDLGGTAPSIGGVSLPNAAPGADNLTLVFTAGVTTFNLATSDVGQYSINLLEDSVVIPSAPPTNVSVSVTGSSNTATVRPFGFDIDFSGQRAADWLDDGIVNDSTGTNTSFAQDQDDTVFVSAGSSFSTTVRGVLWQTADDAGDDGIPDTGANLTDNSAAVSFGQEGETVTLTHTLVLPSGGANGSLTNGLVNSFTNGVGVTNLTWDEVGIIDLSASLTDNDYLGSGADVTGNVADVGRFTPDHFEVVDMGITNRIDSSCVVASNFTYMDETMEVSFEVEALNASGDPTENYVGLFAKLANFSELGFAALSAGDIDLSARLADDSSPSFSWVAGRLNYQARLIFTRLVATDGSFEGLRLGVAPKDSDMVEAISFDLDVDGDSTDEHVDVGSTNIRFGRLRGVSAFGPETEALGVPVLAEYYDESDFVTNLDDTCTTLVAANFDLNVVDDDASPNDSENPLPGVITGLTIDSGTSNGDIGNSPILAGDAGFSFTAPGIGNTSKIEIELDLDVLANPLPWLKFDWLGSGTDINPPQFDAVFGRYRGNDRIIYWRECFGVC